MRYGFAATLLLLAPIAFADQYVCPNTYQTVMSGYTSAQVAAACGQPTAVDSQMISQTTPVTYTQWVYTTTINNLPQNVNNMLPRLLITFKDNQAVEIVTNSQAVATLFSCYSSGRIAIGNTTQQIQAACGTPTTVNSIQRGVNENIQLTTWTYNFGAYKPTIIFTFKSDKLDTIRMGGMGK